MEEVDIDVEDDDILKLRLKQARRIWGDIYLPLTDFIEDRKYYKIDKVDDAIIIKKVKIVVE